MIIDGNIKYMCVFTTRMKMNPLYFIHFDVRSCSCADIDVFSGSVIRCMRRLEETLRQMVQAAKAIGNTELENKFAEGIRLIKRDIVFAASLYL